MNYLSTLFLSLFVTMPLIPVLIRFAGKLHAMDMPDERKVHDHPIPRIGGIAMVIGTFVPALLWVTPCRFFTAFAIGVAIIVVFGLIDDLRDLPYSVKFGGQVVAAFVMVLYGELRIENLGALLPDGIILPGWIAVMLTVVVIVGVTNAVNLADGLDGLAGGISLISFCCIAYLAHIEESSVVALISVSLIGVIFGFLRYNTYPATLFMGDTGSQFLGFSLAAMSIGLTQAETSLSPLLPLIILGFPVLDTLTVMGERIASGMSPFAADKNHFHHRLIRFGLFHTEAVFIIYLVQAVLVIAAFSFRHYSEWVLLSGYLVFSALILGGFFLGDKTGWKFKRYDFVDRAIKDRLKMLRGRSLAIRVSFKITELGTLLLLFVTCFFPVEIPRYFSIFSMFLLVLMGITWFFKRAWMRGALALSLYPFIPFIVHLSAVQQENWLPDNLLALSNWFFLVLVFFVVMTLKFTHRKRGFKATPMDFLILFIALIAPYVAGAYSQYSGLGVVAAKSLVMFFSYEVIIGELRGEYGKLAIATAVSLGVVAVRGFL